MSIEISTPVDQAPVDSDAGSPSKPYPEEPASGSPIASPERPTPKRAQLYRHFKGNTYEIVTVSQHTETHEALVTYRSWPPVAGEIPHTRPLEMFMSTVDGGQYRYEPYKPQPSKPRAPHPTSTRT
ncbi:DUF1653 domain-containing protein [Microvirga massiliensis]|uniref:DUF1653 domain-containing protein n=1 Tax=Microvirga massiliensis TaxID=1033741 RepID=UPI0006616ECC|nr:DUF1653 domain-containing protein [Microvirga massiliensis]